MALGIDVVLRGHGIGVGGGAAAERGEHAAADRAVAAAEDLPVPVIAEHPRGRGHRRAQLLGLLHRDPLAQRVVDRGVGRRGVAGGRCRGRGRLLQIPVPLEVVHRVGHRELVRDGVGVAGEVALGVVGLVRGLAGQRQRAVGGAADAGDRVRDGLLVGDGVGAVEDLLIRQLVPRRPARGPGIAALRDHPAVGVVVRRLRRHQPAADIDRVPDRVAGLVIRRRRALLEVLRGGQQVPGGVVALRRLDAVVGLTGAQVQRVPRRRALPAQVVAEALCRQVRAGLVPPPALSTLTT